jgi:FMN-dependent oxidoreductase (nitrilotriacetate monooxygenase family)
MGSKPDKHMILSIFMITAGYHYDSWTMPGSRVEELGKFGLVKEMAQKAEAAKLDIAFFGDIASAGKVPGADPTVAGHYEPFTTMAALAQHTSNIGLVGTGSTSFYEPFNLARLVAGLDEMSNGRAGWNMVTSSSGHENFGIENAGTSEERYRRATEFADIVTRLWDSWSDDAMICDRENGVWADPARIKPLKHSGEFFDVQGPLNMRRPVQGRPVLVQAGSSSAGLEFGSAYADAIYTTQPLKDEAVRFYKGFKDQVRSKGRRPEDVKVIPGIVPILGRTDKEAQDVMRNLGDHVNMETGRYLLENRLEMKLGEVGLDERIPATYWRQGPVKQSKSRWEVFRHLGEDKGYTLRELILEHSRGHGHQWVAGTPSKVADLMVDWFDSGACDGFNLNAPYIMGGFDSICELLVPELQDRGYFREEYEGTTLRENLGLARPAAWDRQATA